MRDPHVLRKWPGNARAESDKVSINDENHSDTGSQGIVLILDGQVPTMVSYSGSNVVRWGFLSTRPQDDKHITHEYEWFKIYLDPQEYEVARNSPGARALGHNFPPTHDDVRRCYREFLGKIRYEIEKQLAGQLGVPWQAAQVEYLLSIPTTWTSFGVANDFEALARDAGFGQGGPKHTCAITLTEAEAAAVYSFKSQQISFVVGEVDAVWSKQS